MSGLATIIDAGAQTSIQDAGRMGVRHLGIPQSGAADRLSLALANGALGNRWNAAALECALLGVSLRFDAETSFALGGADMGAKLNDAPIDLYTAYMAQRGDVLTLGKARKGLRSYIAFAGGLAGQTDFASVASYPPARLGGLNGEPVKAGDQLISAKGETSASVATAQMAPALSPQTILRITPGPEQSLFNEAQREAFATQPFAASRRANRMGLELNGPTMAPPASFSMISSPVFPGTIQCPPSGNPFLLLSDAQTVGGYARIAQVIDADLHLAGQIRPGDKVWFKPVSADEARTIAAQQTAYISAFLPGFRFG